jgi:hypothetical protein
VLARLAAAVQRLSVTALHLLRVLPLPVLSYGDSSGDCQDGVEATMANFAAMVGQEVDASRPSFRALIGLALRLMLRQHKSPLIKQLFESSASLSTSSSHLEPPVVQIDRFKALKDPGDRLQHTVLAQIQRQMGDGARNMRGNKWWRVSYVGMKFEQSRPAGEEEADPVFEAFAAENKMKKCPQCSAWVQKINGCDAIHCLCNLVFCYQCAGVLPEDVGPGIKPCQCPDVPSLLRSHRGQSNHNMSSELEAAWYRESMRLLSVEFHRWAQAPEIEQASTVKKPLFVVLSDGLLVPNTSCPVDEVAELYEFCGQLFGACARGTAKGGNQ